MAEEETKKTTVQEGTGDKTTATAITSEGTDVTTTEAVTPDKKTNPATPAADTTPSDTDNTAGNVERHTEAAESVPKTPEAKHGVVAHDDVTKPSESHTEAENGNAGCGCGNDACECDSDACKCDKTEAKPTAVPQKAASNEIPPKPGMDGSCGCEHATHDGNAKARKPHTHKGHDTLLLALGIVGVVLGVSGLAIACSVSNEVAALKSNVSSMQDSIDEDMSVMPPFGFLDNDDAYGNWLDRHGLSDDGNTKVGFIGVRVQDSTTGTSGAEVVGVSVGEPADKAGIEKGDVIVSFAGENVTDAEDLVDLVRDAKIGSTQSVVVVRDGGTKTLSVTVGSTLGGSNGSTSANGNETSDGDTGNGTQNGTNGNANGSTLDGGGKLRSN